MDAITEITAPFQGLTNPCATRTQAFGLGYRMVGPTGLHNAGMYSSATPFHHHASATSKRASEGAGAR